MASELEVTKKHFYSKYHSLYKSDDSLVIEDCRFQIFTDLLFEADILNAPPNVSRKKGVYKRANFSLLGYTINSVRYIENEDDEVNDDKNFDNSTISEILNWDYKIINGFFSSGLEVENAKKDEISKSLKEVVKYLQATIEGYIINDLCEARGLQDELKQAYRNNQLDKLEIYIITDKVITQDDLEKKVDINEELTINIHYWDLKKWNDLKRNKSKRLPVTVDLNEKDYKSYHIDYVKRVADNNMSQYLAIFPANLIADLYDYHTTSLLENNVRVFLSANRKANKAIRNTIKNEPEKFFSFNNGISATAEKIYFDKDDLKKIEDFQIVNGGQTTASIHYSRKKDRSDLNRVYVPVKITELKKDKYYGNTVNNISKAANTQTAIRSSDFYANNPFLIEIERLTQKNPVSRNGGENIYYFFERMSGQFNVTKNSVSTRKKKVDAWLNEHPKDLSFTKIEIARWTNCMEGFPYIAALSAEKQFVNFMEEKDFERKEMTFGIFKTLIGFGMMFNRIRTLVGTKTSKIYPSIIGDSSVGMATAIYAASIFNQLSKGKFDYWAVYDLEYGVSESLLVKKKRVNLDIDEILIQIINESWIQLSNYGKTSVQEQTKKLECWKYFKDNFRLKKETLNAIKKYTISNEILKNRQAVNVNSEDKIYFDGLKVLLGDNGKIICSLLEISNREHDLRDMKNKISNLIKKAKNKNSLILRKRVNEVKDFYDLVINKGYSLNHDIEEEIISINYYKVYEKYFIDFEKFKISAEDKILEDEINFTENTKIFNEIVDIKEKLEREYGLSLEDLKYLEGHINSFD